MADQLHPFASVTGIEFLPSLQAAATGVLERYVTGFQPALGRQALVVSKQGDMLQQDLRDADIIFVHATYMPATLIDALGEKIVTCKPSARFILISRGFFGSPSFDCVEQLEYTNAWKTTSICYIYQLKPQAVAQAASKARARFELA